MKKMQPAKPKMMRKSAKVPKIPMPMKKGGKC